MSDLLDDLNSALNRPVGMEWIPPTCIATRKDTVKPIPANVSPRLQYTFVPTRWDNVWDRKDYTKPQDKVFEDVNNEGTLPLVEWVLFEKGTGYLFWEKGMPLFSYWVAYNQDYDLLIKVERDDGTEYVFRSEFTYNIVSKVHALLRDVLDTEA